MERAIRDVDEAWWLAAALCLLVITAELVERRSDARVV
jgi:hypothetical protein